MTTPTIPAISYAPEPVAKPLDLDLDAALRRADAAEAENERLRADIARRESAYTRNVANLDVALATFRRVTQGIAAAREKQLANALDENRQLRAQIESLQRPG